MIYVIDGVIEYDADQMTLKVIGQQAGQTLTLTTARLLSLLLQHHGNVVHREMIFENVWDAFDKTPSSSNLNQYIFLLRKNFVRLGLNKEVIVTIPRIGFMICNDVTVECSVNKKIELLPTSNAQLDHHSPGNKSKMIYTYMVLGATILTSLCAIMIFYSSENFLLHPNPNDNLRVVDRIKNCTFYSLQHDNYFHLIELDKFLSRFKISYNQICEEGIRADIYLRFNERYMSNDYSKSAVTFCNKNSTGEYIFCKNEIHIYKNGKLV